MTRNNIQILSIFLYSTRDSDFPQNEEFNQRYGFHLTVRLYEDHQSNKKIPEARVTRSSCFDTAECFYRWSAKAKINQKHN